MINTTDELVVLQSDDELNISIQQSIDETIKALKLIYRTKSDVKPFHITAARNNQFRELAFLRYVAPFQKKRHTKEWLVEFYRLVCSGARRGGVSKVDPSLLSNLVNEDPPKSLCDSIIRGMRLFYLSLWGKKAVLLTMNFKLPSTKRDQDVGRSFYSELLYSVRTPMMKGDVDVSKSLIPHLKHTAYRNVYWYYWKPVVASDWHAIEDVNNEDLIKYFEEIARRNKEGTEKTSYPVSSTGFLGVLYKKYGDRCRFEIESISKFNPRAERSAKDLAFELEAFSSLTDYPGQKSSWLSLEKSYIVLLEKGRSKSNVKHASRTLSKLNLYLFSILPKAGYTPPFPSNFNRRFLDGLEVPSITETTITKASLFISLEQFFTYIESVSDSYDGAEGFRNPLINLDKPTEKKRQSTNKKTFSIDDFRFIYELSYCVSEASWYINSTIANGGGVEPLPSSTKSVFESFPCKIKSLKDLVSVKELESMLEIPDYPYKAASILMSYRSNFFEELLKKNKNRSVIDMEEFGYVPIISYQCLSDERKVMVPVRFIPTKILKVVSVVLKGSDRYTPFLAMQNINQVVTALETGLRHITVRWLDKRTYRYGKVEKGSKYFNLNVNSDKVTNGWVRPTSQKLLEVLDRQVASHKWFDDDQMNHLIHYNNEKGTRHGKISPIFIRYDKKEVYGEHVASGYYNALMYYVSLLKLTVGENSIEEVNPNVECLDFTNKAGVEAAWRYFDGFSSSFTPHGTRASVVSIMSTVLPADIIGQFITGHVSADTVKYYTVVNIEMMREMGIIDNVDLEGKVAKVLSLITPLKINADSKDAKIRKHLMHGNKSIASVMNDFGGCSFSLEMGEQYVSGLEEIKKVDRSRLAFLPTHICPLENDCPKSIKASIGEKQCGQCPYSVKTVDHLTGIQAKCRYLARELDAMKKLMKHHKSKNGGSEESEVIQSQYMRMASELAAWTLTERILRTNYESLKNKVLVNKPELLMVAVEERDVPSDWLSKLMIECEDAAAYPELANSTLEAHVLRCRTRIVSSKNQLEEYYGKNDEYDPVEGFRHHVRAFCMATGKTPNELVSFIEDNKSRSLEADGLSASNLLPSF